MRDRINLRWTITTAVVVAVAAAGTAATMRRADCCADTESTTGSKASFDTGAVRHVRQIEPARLSHDTGASAANLPPFEFEGLPPMASAFAPMSSNRNSMFSAHENGEFWSSRPAAWFPTGFSGGDGWLRGAGGGFGAFSAGGGSSPGNSSHPSSAEPSVNAAAPASSTTGPAPVPAVPPSAEPTRPSAPSGPPASTVASTPAVISPVPSTISDVPGGGVSAPAASTTASSTLPNGDPGGPPTLGTADTLSPTPEPGSLLLMGTGFSARRCDPASSSLIAHGRGTRPRAALSRSGGCTVRPARRSSPNGCRAPTRRTVSR